MFWTVVLEKTLESPFDCKEIQPVNPKGNQSWIFIGRTDDEADTLILWPPDAKNWLIWKDPDAEKIEGRRRRGRKVEGEGDDKGWDGWMASLTRLKLVWVNSRSLWWTGRPGILRFMGLQSQTWLSDWTELNWTESNRCLFSVIWNVVFYLVGEFPPCHESETTIPRSYHHYPHWAGGKGKSVEKTRMC